MALDDSNGGGERLREEVQRAVQEKARGGSSQSYQRLVERLKQAERQARADDRAAQELAGLLAAVTSCCAAVTPRRHEALLQAVLGIPLWTSHPLVRSAVLGLVSNLVVANGQCVGLCLEMLVMSLLPPLKAGQPPQPDEGGPWVPDRHAAEVQGEVVTAMERVLALVPTAPPHAIRLLVSSMPHKLRDRTTHALFLSAIFALCEGGAGAAVREELLGAVIDHLISIDVEIKWEDIVDQPSGQEAEEEGDSDPEDGDDIFELEGMSALEIAKHNGEGAGLADAHQEAAAGHGAEAQIGWEGAAVQSTHHVNRRWGADRKTHSVDETAEKLDSLMELTLLHISRRCQAGQLEDVWATVMEAFQRTILHTHRSKFTQYIVFYLCSREPVLCSKALVHTLLALLDAKQAAPITRAACAAYLASFLARGKFVPLEVVVGTLHSMADWAIRYATTQDQKQQTAGNRAGVLYAEERAPMVSAQGSQTPHQVFYAVTQALLYILCYHLKPLMQDKGEPKLVMAAKSLVSQSLPRILGHALDPLSKCLPSVIEEFSRQSAQLGLGGCSEWLKMALDRPTSETRPLSMFFPFDPYLLLRSRSLLNLPETYVVWKSGHPANGVPNDDDDDTDSNASNLGSSVNEEQEEEEEEEEEEEDEEKQTRFGSLASSSPMGASPSPMGISPHLGLRYFAAKRQASGLDSYGMPVALLQKQVERHASNKLSAGYPLNSPQSDTDGCESPAGASPHGQSPYMGFNGPSPMSLGCTPTTSYMPRTWQQP